MSRRFFSPLVPVAGVLLATAAVLIASVPAARATIYTWSSAGGSPDTDGGGNWNPTGGSNWDNAGTYSAWSNSLTDTAVFGVGNGAAGTITVGNVNVGNITFNAPGSGSYMLTGGNITFGGTTPTITTNAASATIGSVLAGTAGLTTAGTGTLTVGGAANTYSGGTTITAGTLATTNFANLGSGTISIGSAGTYLLTTNGTQPTFSNAVSGSGAFNVAGSGANQSFWSGTFSTFGGTLTIGAGAALWAESSNTGSTSMRAAVNGAFGLYSKSSSLTCTYNLGELSGTNSGADIFGNPGTSNVITLSVGSLGTSTTFAGTIENNWNNDTTSTVALSKVGGGMLTLSGVNYYTGGTTVSGGTLQIGDGVANNGAVAGNITNNSTLAFANPTQYNYTGLISGSGNLVKSGTGMLWFNNSTAQSYNGATTIQAGTLRAANYLMPETYGSMNVYPGAVLDMYASNFSINSLSGSGMVNQSYSNAIVLTVGGTSEFDGVISNGGGGGSVALTKAGSGIFTLTGSNTYTGATVIGGGTLAITGAGVLGNGSYSAGITNNAALVFASASNQTLSGAISGSGGLTKAGTGTLTLGSAANTYSGGTTIAAGTLATTNFANLGSGTISIGSAGTYLFTTNGSNQPTFSNAVSGAGAFSVVNGGGANQSFWSGSFSTFGGTLTIGSGASWWAESNNLGSASMTANVAGTLALYDKQTNLTATYNIGALSSISGATIWGQPSTNNVITLSVGALGTSTTFAGTIENNWNNDTTSTVGLVKVGTGELTLSGANYYTGGTTISGGTLAATNFAIPSTGGLYIAPSATFGFTTTGSNKPTVTSAVSGSGSFTVASSAGNQSFWGGSWVNFAGTLNITTTGGWWAETSNTGSTAMRAVVNGQLGLYDNESNITRTYNLGELSGTNSGAGIFGQPSTNNVVTLSVGALGTSTAFAGTIENNWNNDSTSTLGLLKVGSGMLTLSGVNSYSGGTTISGGTLATVNFASLGSGPISIGAAGTYSLDTTGFNQPRFANVVNGTGTFNAAGSPNNQSFWSGNWSAFSGTLSLASGAGFWAESSNTGSTAMTVNLGGTGSLGLYDNESGITRTYNVGELDGTAGAVISGQPNTANQVTLSVGGLNTSSTFGGIIQNNWQSSTDSTSTMALTKTGSGMLTLTGANTYTGPTTVSGGTLQIGNGTSGNDGSLASGSNIVNNAAVVFNTYSSQSNASAISGTGGLTKLGPGTLTLGGSSTYSGGTTIGAGLLQAGTPQALGSGAVSLSSGGTLGVGFTLPNNVTLTGGAIAANGSAWLTGNLSGPSGLTAVGPGVLNLSGANTYSGPTVVSAGTLRLSAPASAALPAGMKIMPIGDSITYGVAGTNAGYRGYLYNDLMASGGTFQFVGTTNGNPGSLPTTPINQTYHDGWPGWTTGDVLGTVVASSYNNGSSGDIGTWLTALSGSNQSPTIITMMIGTNDWFLGGWSVSQGTTNVAAIISTAFADDPGVKFLLAQVTPRSDSSTANTWDNQYNAALVGLVARDQALGDNIALVNLNTNFPSNGLSSDNLHPNDIGYAFMAGQWANAILGGSTAAVTSAIPLNSPTAVAAGATFDLAGNAASIGPLSGAGSITLGTGGGLVVNSTTGNNTTFSGVISGSGSLTKTGPATLTLSGPDTYSGGTSIEAGTMLLGNSNALGTGNVTVNAGTLDLAGYSPSVAGLSGVTGTILSSSTAPVTLTANVTSGTAAFGGNIANGAGTVALVLGGPGTQVLSGSNTYSGGTTIEGGTLVLGNNNALGTGSVLLGGGSLNLNGYANSDTAVTLTGGTLAGSGQLGPINAQAGTIAANLSGGGGLDKTTAGLVLLSGNNSYAGGTTVGGGVLQVGSNVALPTIGSLTVNGGTLDLNGNNPTIGALQSTLTTGVVASSSGPATLTAGSGGASSAFGGVLTDGNGIVGLVKTGGGTLTLNGVNSYSGGTTVSGGVLQLSGATALGSTSGALTVNAGTLDLAGNNPTIGALQSTLTTGVVASSTGPATLIAGAGDATSTFNGVIVDGVGPVSLVKSGSGMLTLAGANSYTGGTTISSGTLGITNAASMSTGTVTIAAATLQTTGAVALDNVIQLTDPASMLNTPYGESLTLNGLVTGSGALNKVGAGTLALAETGGNSYSGDTNVLQGTLLALADNALSPASNMVISDGASVILDFGGGVSYDSLGGLPPPAPTLAAAAIAAPVLAPAGISTVPEPGTLALLVAGALAGLMVCRRRTR